MLGLYPQRIFCPCCRSPMNNVRSLKNMHFMLCISCSWKSKSIPKDIKFLQKDVDCQRMMEKDKASKNRKA